MNLHRIFIPTISAAALLLFSGCGISKTLVPTPIAGPQFRGSVYGGQQPVVGVTIQLYAAGNTGYGSTFIYAEGTSLLGTHLVKTDAGGGFTITDDYTCPDASTLVYLVGTGGFPIVGQPVNNTLALMAALGPCGDLRPDTFINVNELTTVASVWALSPFMTGIANVGTSSTNSVGLVNAFSSVNKLVDISTGKLSGPALPTGATLPANELNTLADILAICVNSSGGTDGDTTPCGDLFALTHAGNGAVPTDTITAALNIAQNPTQNVEALRILPTPTAPFEPVSGSPLPAWTIAIRYKANTGLSAPSGIAADQAGNIWVANKATNNVVKFDTNGNVLSSYAAGQAGLGLLAIDGTGNAWAPGVSAGSLIRITSGGSVSTFSGGGLDTTTSLAIDAQGKVWASGDLGVSAFASDGTALSPSGAFNGGGVTSAQSIAIAGR